MVTTSWNLVPALATTPKCFCNTSKGESFRREISKEASILYYEVVISRLQSYYCWEHFLKTSFWRFWRGHFPLAATKSWFWHLLLLLQSIDADSVKQHCSNLIFEDLGEIHQFQYMKVWIFTETNEAIRKVQCQCCVPSHLIFDYGCNTWSRRQRSLCIHSCTNRKY